MKLDVAFLPEEVKGQDLSDTVCMVLDIFRATSSMVTAFANGCKGIFPVLTVEEARQLAESMDSVLLAGERQSVRIEGFDLGNSPYEFSKDKVGGKDIVMTTSNGTVAIRAVAHAYRTYIGSFLNADAVCRRAAAYNKDVLIVCAGTDRLFSLEDSLCAGLLTELLSVEQDFQLTDAAQAARMLYQQADGQLAEKAQNSRNGKRLFDLGRMEDILYCFQRNLSVLVPTYIAGRIICEKETNQEGI